MSGKRTRPVSGPVLAIAAAALILLLLFAISARSADRFEPHAVEDFVLAAPVEGLEIVKHAGFTLCYSERYEVPAWVAYVLERDKVDGPYDRSDNFREDAAVSTGSSTPEDYYKSGYDRGHMAPAADFRWSEEAMEDTFLLSNICPQDGAFNRGIWADLEAMVRVNAYEEGVLYVVTGPILSDGEYETIGENEVAVPKRFYKVMLAFDGENAKAIGFVLGNEGSSRRLESYATSVDDVERISGLDFYPGLPDDVETKAEGRYDTALWSFETSLPDLSYTVYEDEIDYVKGLSNLAGIVDGAMKLIEKATKGN